MRCAWDRGHLFDVLEVRYSLQKYAHENLNFVRDKGFLISGCLRVIKLYLFICLTKHFPKPLADEFRYSRLSQWYQPQVKGNRERPPLVLESSIKNLSFTNKL